MTKKFFVNLIVKSTLTLISGGTLIFSYDDIFSLFCAGSVLASVISSSISDKNYKPIMDLINVIAGNIDKATNGDQYQK